MVVLSESSPKLTPSATRGDLLRATEAASLAGCRVYHIPQKWPESVTAEDALCHVPVLAMPEKAIWIGYIPTARKYQEIHAAAARRQIHLVNSPKEFRRAEEFDRFYPLIEDLTARSVVTSSVEECLKAAEGIGFPVFLKGAIQSLKHEGLGSCVANNVDEAEAIAGKLLRADRRSLNKVIVREHLSLRSSRTGPGGLPVGREYRVFVFEGRVVGRGFYWEWEGDDPLSALSLEEKAAVDALAIEAAGRLKVPYLSVDIGQKTDGEWGVIEVGDGQFSGLVTIPALELWHCLTKQ